MLLKEQQLFSSYHPLEFLTKRLKFLTKCQKNYRYLVVNLMSSHYFSLRLPSLGTGRIFPKKGKNKNLFMLPEKIFRLQKERVFCQKSKNSCGG